MTETPFYFPNGDYSLFGILHEPAGQARHSPFVFCHPLVEEKLWAHRVFVSFARRLAAAGHPVLRFDYMGSGDSDGSFSQVSLATVCSDLRCALQFLRQATGNQRVNLLGLRFGATVASLVAEDDQETGSLVLWAPVVDGARYMQELLRMNLTTQLATYKSITQDREALVSSMRDGHTVNVDGYEMALPMYEEVSRVQLAAAPKRHAGPCLIVNVDRQPERVPPELQALAASYGRGRLAAVQEEPFWKEIARFYDAAPALFTQTCEWLGGA